MNAKSIFGPEGSIPREEDWGHEELSSSLLFRKPQEPGQFVETGRRGFDDILMNMTIESRLDKYLILSHYTHDDTRHREHRQ